MAIRDVSTGFPQKSMKFSYTGSGQKEWITGIQPPFSCAIFPTGTAKIEYTFAPVAELETTTDILTWPNGDVAAGSHAAIYSAVTAIRVVTTSGNVNLYVSGMVH